MRHDVKEPRRHPSQLLFPGKLPMLSPLSLVCLEVRYCSFYLVFDGIAALEHNEEVAFMPARRRVVRHDAGRAGSMPVPQRALHVMLIHIVNYRWILHGSMQRNMPYGASRVFLAASMMSEPNI